MEYIEECVALSILFRHTLTDDATASRSRPQDAAYSHPLNIHVGNLTSNTSDPTNLSSPDHRALVRLQADHVNRSLVPAFYRYLQAQDSTAQIETGKEFHSSIEGLVALFERAELEVLSGGGFSGEGEKKAVAAGLGLWVEGSTELGWTDVMAGPCESASMLLGRWLKGY